MEIEIKNIEETKLLAEIFGRNISDKGAFVSLYGDIGAGKTAFSRFLIKSFKVTEDVTSPSFVILNEYKTQFFPIYHFDLYRLEKEGIESVRQELSEYSKENVLTLVEWAEFGKNELPFHRIDIKISYDIENYSQKRTFLFSGTNAYYNDIINKTVKDFAGAK